MEHDDAIIRIYDYEHANPTADGVPTLIRATQWMARQYRRLADEGFVQYREMRNAFFAGAFVVSMALELIGANPNITEEQGVNYLEGIREEVMTHFKTIGQRNAEIN